MDLVILFDWFTNERVGHGSINPCRRIAQMEN
jgi:hypothetical protein